jgi:hypothetical protein
MFYIVFGSIKRPADLMGGKKLDWGQPPVGVYEADTPEQACQAAASDQGMMATYCAVECTPWGIDLMDAPARQLGRTLSPNERIAQHLDAVDKLEQQRQQLEAQRHREPTREERIAAAEARSAEIEHEAGLDE